MSLTYFGLVIIVLVVVGVLTFRKKKNQRNVFSDLPPKSPVPAEFVVADTPVSFGYKCSWLAVYTHETQKLADRIGLKNAAPCNWKEGIENAYDDRVFISPPVDGWSFVISARQLPGADDQKSVYLIKDMLVRLSTEFSQAQYFGTHRVVSYDGWIKAQNGHIERAYGYADGVNTIVEGEPTDVEKNYNLVNTFSEEFRNDPGYLERYDLDYPDESMTMEVAGAWSINPQELDDRKGVVSGLGLVGVLV